jgi:UDP-N-acetylglucosamine 2-epimerase (non-hydrolysing)
VVTGNTVIDALVQAVDSGYRFTQPPLKDMDFEFQKGYTPYLPPAGEHRRANGGNLQRGEGYYRRPIGMLKWYTRCTETPRCLIPPEAFWEGRERIHLIEPLDYLPFANLMGRCFMVMTDSGGIQEEAPSLGKPVLVLREVTERPEAVQGGHRKAGRRQKGGRGKGRIGTPGG